MKEKPYPSDQAPKFVVRFKEGMRDKIKARARANRRSMNTEILVMLETAMTNKNAPLAGEAFDAVKTR